MDSSEPTEPIEQSQPFAPDPIPDVIAGPAEDTVAAEDVGGIRPPTRREANARTLPVGTHTRRLIRTRGAARVLAFTGALLFAVAGWLPWVVATGADAANPLAGTVQLPLDPGSVGAPPLPSFYHLGAAFVVWSTLSVLGTLLAALLWFGAGQLSAFLTWLGYTTWLLFASYTSVRTTMAMLDAPGRTLRLAPGAGPVTLAVQGVGLDVGLPLAALALLLAWTGGVLVLAAGAKGLAQARAVTPAPGAPQSLGRWLLLAGLAGWAVGFLEMAWVSAECADPVLGIGSCAGVRSTDLLGYMLGSAASPSLPTGALDVFVGIDPRAALYAIPTALLGAALLLAIAFWRRARTPAVYTWAALWLLAASGVAILAQAGARQLVAGATAPGLPAGAWQAGQGIYVTLGSLVLLLLGLAVHWLSPLVSRGHQMQPA